MPNKILFKTPEQKENIRESGKYLTELLEIIGKAAQPGIILMELEVQAQRFMDMHNLKGAFKWYQWFPANLCLSVNDCVVHGIPDATILQEGDLLKIDAWVIYKEWISDSAVTLVVGWAKHNPVGQELTNATKESLDESLKFVGPWVSLYDFGDSVDSIMQKRGFRIIKTLTWHGVGTHVHEPPSIYNRWYKPLKKQYFQEWMIVALEPITAEQSKEFVQGDNWRNLYTQKWDLGAQWEYTVAITPDGYEILAWHTTNPFI